MGSKFIGAFGWFSSGCLLFAYTMTSYGMYDPTSGKVHLLNLIGAVGLGLVTYMRGAFQATLVNVVWGGIAASGLFRIFF